jgi:hypothetical protein
MMVMVAAAVVLMLLLMIMMNYKNIFGHLFLCLTYLNLFVCLSVWLV